MQVPAAREASSDVNSGSLSVKMLFSLYVRCSWKGHWEISDDGFRGPCGLSPIFPMYHEGIECFMPQNIWTNILESAMPKCAQYMFVSMGKSGACADYMTITTFIIRHWAEYKCCFQHVICMPCLNQFLDATETLPCCPNRTECKFVRQG